MEAESFGCGRQYLAPQDTFTYFVTISVLNHRINSIISLLSFYRLLSNIYPGNTATKWNFFFPLPLTIQHNHSEPVPVTLGNSH